ncbi:MAG: MFS transporter [Pseudomonadota bacterium]
MSRIRRSAPASASAIIFFANGFMLSNWFLRIPSVKDALQLSESQLGLALLFFAVGGVLAMPVGGALVARMGSGKVAVAAGFFLCATMWLPGAAPGLLSLAIALAIAGSANGIMDVAMNAQADTAEGHVGMGIMSFCHAMFSLGFAFGTLPAGAFAAASISPGAHILVAGVFAAIAVGYAARSVQADRDQVDQDQGGPAQPSFALPRGPLLFFGMICFCGAVVEGAIYDWVAVYMEEVRLAGPLETSAAFGVFAGAMVLSRLMGDTVSERIGADRAVRAGLLLAAVGMTIALTLPSPIHIVGFAAVGLGVAGVFPSVFRAAGNLPGRPAGPSMAAAVTLGYTGFLLAPPFIGFLADATSLGTALWVLIPLSLIGAALAGTLRAAE